MQNYQIDHKDQSSSLVHTVAQEKDNYSRNKEITLSDSFSEVIHTGTRAHFNII